MGKRKASANTKEKKRRQKKKAKLATNPITDEKCFDENSLKEEKGKECSAEIKFCDKKDTVESADEQTDFPTSLDLKNVTLMELQVFTFKVEAHLESLLQEIQSNSIFMENLIKERVPKKKKRKQKMRIDPSSMNKENHGKNKEKLRTVIIDGSNVAREHGKLTNSYSVQGIRIAVEFFEKRGHRVSAVVPRHNLTNNCRVPVLDRDLLVEMEKQGRIILSPSRQCGTTMQISYDDRLILNIASDVDGVVISNDQFNDLIDESVAFEKVIKQRTIMFNFFGDLFYVPIDPMGRNGPTLDELLKSDSTQKLDVNGAKHRKAAVNEAVKEVSEFPESISDPVELKYKNCVLRRSDVDLLTPPHWLNDNILYFWCLYLQHQLFSDHQDTLGIVCPQIVQWLKYCETDEVKATIEELQLKSKKLIFFPLNDCKAQSVPGGTHWSLLTFNVPEKFFEHYDSLPGSCNHRVAEDLAKVLAVFLDGQTPLIHERPCTQQINTYDCGMHVICNAEGLCKKLISNDKRSLSEIVPSNVIECSREYVKTIINSLRQ